MPEIRIFKAKIAEKKDLTYKILELKIDLLEPKEVSFKAGQFIMLEVGDVRRRPYSIVSVPAEKNNIVLCVDHSPDGLGSKYIRNLKIGDEVEFRGPHGIFTIADTNQDITFIATGAGIAPFVSMISDLLGAGYAHNATLIFGVRNESDIFYHDIFKALAEKYSNFKFVPILSQRQKKWSGFKGRVTDYLRAHEVPQNQMFYICGGPPVIKDTRAVLIEKGIAPTKIKIEVFT